MAAAATAEARAMVELGSREQQLLGFALRKATKHSEGQARNARAKGNERWGTIHDTEAAEYAALAVKVGVP